MAIIDARVARIYFDANIFIYTVEAHRDHAGVLATIFEEIQEHSQQVVTSELTLAECLIGARRAGSRTLEEIYENLLSPGDMILPVPVSRDILRGAALYAGDAKIKLPDAIHIVSALALDCGVFLTNDRRMVAPSTLRMLQLGDLMPV